MAEATNSSNLTECHTIFHCHSPVIYRNIAEPHVPAEYDISTLPDDEKTSFMDAFVEDITRQCADPLLDNPQSVFLLFQQKHVARIVRTYSSRASQNGQHKEGTYSEEKIVEHGSVLWILITGTSFLLKFLE
ncbi:hypothetical protein A0H81_04354 [Grifola frondosa]|uniref:Uncharacterized protein n=1 Tax=Grifola frondosa TaxID=5627 RepID=A0A1C7MFR1_GRIFR|nr:hypothetical protein A0H81_04354 [Grifola frondosa]